MTVNWNKWYLKKIKYTYYLYFNIYNYILPIKKWIRGNSSYVLQLPIENELNRAEREKIITVNHFPKKSHVYGCRWIFTVNWMKYSKCFFKICWM